MTDTTRELLHRHLPAAHAAAIDVPTFAAAWSRACAGCPGVVLALSDFLAFLATKLADIAPADVLTTLRIDDLYLVCACLRHDPRALTVLGERHLSRLHLRLARTGLPSAVAQDAQQQLAAQLLVTEDGRPPRLGQYAGRGDLEGWIFVAALRAARRQARQEANTKVVGELEAIAEFTAPADDAELHHLKQRYHHEFRAAFATALAEFDERERNLLRYQILEGLGVEAIGALYQVHRATAARWLVRLRERLAERTRELLMQQLRLDASQTESIIRLVRSQLGASLVSALAPTDP